MESSIKLLIALFFVTSVAHAQEDMITITREGTSKAQTAPDAAREIQAEVLSGIARERAIDILGEKRYQKSKAQVESKIIRQSAKFIPFVNPGQPTQNSDGSWKMSVETKLSPASLRKMILDAGLLNDAEGPASILPVVAVLDRQKGISLRWWQGEPKDEQHKFVAQLSRGMHDRMQAEFSRAGFHLIKPQGTQTSPLPEPYRNERPGTADYQFMSEYFNAPMVMKGDLRFRESKDTAGVTLCSIKLQVVQVASGRTVAEISRQFATETYSQTSGYEAAVRKKVLSEMPELSKDLATQVLEAWQRGTLNTNLMRLSVRGQMSPKQLGEFKSGLLASVKEVKGLTERMFDPGQVVLEMDYSGDSNVLAEKLRGLQMQTFKTRVATAGAEGITMDVQSR